MRHVCVNQKKFTQQIKGQSLSLAYMVFYQLMSRKKNWDFKQKKLFYFNLQIIFPAESCMHDK